MSEEFMQEFLLIFMRKINHYINFYQATNEFGKLLVESMAKLPKNPSDEDVLRLKEVENYKTSVEQLMNEPASEQSIENYKEAVKKLLYYV